LERAISTVSCRNSKKRLTLPIAIKIAVGQQYFIFLKKQGKKLVFVLNLILYLTLLSNLKKKESIILWLINNISCVN
jgi:hypothetical protein